MIVQWNDILDLNSQLISIVLQQNVKKKNEELSRWRVLVTFRFFT